MICIFNLKADMPELISKQLASKIMFSIFLLFMNFIEPQCSKNLAVYVTLYEPMYLIGQTHPPLPYHVRFHNLLNLFIWLY